jgi:hypothetical protein
MAVHPSSDGSGHTRKSVLRGKGGRTRAAFGSRVGRWRGRTPHEGARHEQRLGRRDGTGGVAEWEEELATEYVVVGEVLGVDAQSELR